MKILVTGRNGQLGSTLVELLAKESRFEVVPTDRADLDITRRDQALAAARFSRPDWIVSCAAYTDVERAETEPERAFLVNDVAVGHLADAAQTVGARLLHVSTDYVFSGEPPPGAALGTPRRPYTEDDVPSPINQYGASKRAGEIRLQAHPVHSVVLRTSWLHGGPGKSFARTMLRVGVEAMKTGRPVKVVEDQIGTPTDVRSLAAQIRAILGTELRGIFHASCQGETSWFGFAREIFRVEGLNVPLVPIRTCDYPTKAKRPAYSVLENRRLAQAGLDLMPHWRVGLEKALATGG